MPKSIKIDLENMVRCQDDEVLAVDLTSNNIVWAASNRESRMSCLYVWPQREMLSREALATLFEQAKIELGKYLKNIRIQILWAGDISAQCRAEIEAADIENLALTSGLAVGEAFFYAASAKFRVLRSAPQPKNNSAQKIRVAIVDDSKTIRDLLEKILSADRAFEIVASFANPVEALEKIPALAPDVVTLDIHMPQMNGVELLQKLLQKKFIPAVMITSLAMEDGPDVLRALELGAVEYIQKPSFSEINQASILIRDKIRAAASAKKVQHSKQMASQGALKFSPAVIASHVVAIGSSTGGTEALRVLLTQFSGEIPPIVIVQHIPSVFSLALAKRLNELCAFEVKEAQDGDLLQAGRVLIAPGGFQMEIRQVGKDLKVQISDAPAVNRHKPSVDVLFSSLLKQKDRRVVAAILTGMGTDGAKGLLELKKSGARTIAQDEASCVVFGMPREAIKLGAADVVSPLGQIPREIIEATQRRRAA